MVGDEVNNRSCSGMISQLRRQRSEHLRTSSQHFSHFFRQVKGRPQTVQTFVGSWFFFTTFLLLQVCQQHLTELQGGWLVDSDRRLRFLYEMCRNHRGFTIVISGRALLMFTYCERFSSGV